MSFLHAVWVVFVKDLKVELRTREIILSTGLFALLVVVLAAFAFGLNTMPGVDASCGVLWIAVAFSGILALGRPITTGGKPIHTTTPNSNQAHSTLMFGDHMVRTLMVMANSIT